MLLVILGNEIARVGREPWVLLVGGRDLGGFGDVGACIGSCGEGGEGRSWHVSGGVWGGIDARRSGLQQGLGEFMK